MRRPADGEASDRQEDQAENGGRGSVSRGVPREAADAVNAGGQKARKSILVVDRDEVRETEADHLGQLSVVRKLGSDDLPQRVERHTQLVPAAEGASPAGISVERDQGRGGDQRVPEARVAGDPAQRSGTPPRVSTGRQ